MPESVSRRSSAVAIGSSYGDSGRRGPGMPRPYTQRVNVRGRLFAALRERAGAGSVEVDLPDGAVVGDVWPALALGDEPPGLLFAVNRDYTDRRAALAPGDEVALIPPVSGGAVEQALFRLSEEPLSVEAAVADVSSPDAGA